MEHSINSLLYSKKERRGLIILISIVLLAFFTWRLLPIFFISNDESEYVELVTRWEEFKEQSLLAASKENKPNIPQRAQVLSDSVANRAQQRNIAVFKFNPNTATKEDFLDLGLPVHTVNILLNFRNKGGQFYRKQDFQKIYTLKEEDYKRLEPYIDLPETKREKRQTSVTEGREYKESQALLIELNTTDTIGLRRLRGIGPYYSKLIIYYRNSLGGFLEVGQLQEIKRLPDSTFHAIEPFLEVNPDLIQKININSISEKDLARHPYISKRLAKQIIKFRDEHEYFENFSDLRQIPLINDENYRKIAPYLSLD